MFLALVLMFKFLVAPMETKSLTNELSSTFNNAVQTAWSSAINVNNAKQVQPYMAALLPVLTRMSASYSTPDKAQVQNNEKAMFWAYGIRKAC